MLTSGTTQVAAPRRPCAVCPRGALAYESSRARGPLPLSAPLPRRRERGGEGKKRDAREGNDDHSLHRHTAEGSPEGDPVGAGEMSGTRRTYPMAEPLLDQRLARACPERCAGTDCAALDLVSHFVSHLFPMNCSLLFENRTKCETRCETR
jgi:hypothetical protein